MERQTLSFVFERETKNTIRYQEESIGKAPVCGTLYVQRWALGEPVPGRLTVIIEEDPADRVVRNALSDLDGRDREGLSR